MVPIAQTPEKVLQRWMENGELRASSWVARLDESVRYLSSLSTVELANLNAYCTTSDDSELRLTSSGFTELFQQFVPIDIGGQILDTAIPILWKIFVYVSRYPFESASQISLDNSMSCTMTRSAFLRALVQLHSLFSDQLFNSDNDERTRAHTNADQRRLLFQAMSSRRLSHQENSPDNEAVWESKSVERASRYWPTHCGVQAARVPNNMGVNRDADGDECFHDLLDFMYALQPGLESAPIARQNFMDTAKGIVSRGEVILTPLREYGLERDDFRNLVQFLLMMYIEGNEDEFKELPRDFEERRDKVVAAFFGADHPKEVIDFLDFDEALTAGTSEVMGGAEFVTNEFVSAIPLLDRQHAMFLWIEYCTNVCS